MFLLVDADDNNKQCVLNDFSPRFSQSEARPQPENRCVCVYVGGMFSPPIPQHPIHIPHGWLASFEVKEKPGGGHRLNSLFAGNNVVGKECHYQNGIAGKAKINGIQI